LGTVDTNQLKNNMADISPNGRFIAAAAFTADVKVSCVASLLLLPFFFWNNFLQYQRPLDGYFLWLTFLLYMSCQCTGIGLH
jgi:hypothetical protein